MAAKKTHTHSQNERRLLLVLSFLFENLKDMEADKTAKSFPAASLQSVIPTKERDRGCQRRSLVSRFETCKSLTFCCKVKIRPGKKHARTPTKLEPPGAQSARSPKTVPDFAPPSPTTAESIACVVDPAVPRFKSKPGRSCLVLPGRSNFAGLPEHTLGAHSFFAVQPHKKLTQDP